MKLIEPIHAETLSLTTAVQSLEDFIPDEVGADEGIALVFKGDHGDMVYIGTSDKTKYFPFPSGEYGEVSVFRRDSMPDSYDNIWSDSAISCTLTSHLVR